MPLVFNTLPMPIAPADDGDCDMATTQETKLFLLTLRSTVPPEIWVDARAALSVIKLNILGHAVLHRVSNLS